MFKTVSIHSNHNEQNKQLISSLIPKLKDIGLIPIRDEGKLKVVLGGDGTFLKVARKYIQHNPVFVGINTGNLGFFSEFSTGDIEELLLAIKGEKYKIDNLYTYEVVINHSNKIERLFFVNDLAIERKGPKVIHGQLFFGDEFVSKFVGDGILISSTAGSTSYNLAAGGAITYDLDNVLQLTPLNSINNAVYQSLSNPLLFKPSSKFVWKEGEDKKRPIRLVVDGKEYFFKDIHSIEVRESKEFIRVLRSLDFSKHHSFSNKILGLNI